MTAPTAFSAFSGIGGLDLAAEAAGFHVVYQSEIEPFACRVLAHHFPHASNLGDIRYVDGTKLAGIDLVFGGFPCQDISVAGSGAGLSGGRSGLWFELSRIIRDARPRVVVLENVANVTVVGGTTVIADLAAIGYDAVWTVIPAAIVGSPQSRRRWFAVAVDNAHGDRAAGLSHQQLHNLFVRDDCKVKSPPISRSYSPARLRSRSGAPRFRTSRRAHEHRVGVRAHGLSAGLANHTFPAGSWLPPTPQEPPRLAPPSARWASETQALGNAVVPQQALPFFLAAIDHLQQETS